MLTIQNLHAAIQDENQQSKIILRGINLNVRRGEVHAIMGPNGSGKSTLANVLAGRDDYTITAGSVTLAGKDLLGLLPEERAAAGLFLAFQYPVEIPGVNNMYFLKAGCDGFYQNNKIKNKRSRSG
jgi:Fe-S cluster assembly ATP-binding protein